MPLIETAQRLAGVLDRENAALRAMDLRAAAALLPEKIAAIADLTEANVSGCDRPDPALVSTVRSLEGLATENRRLLERAIAAQQRVIGIVMRAVAVAVASPSYGASGRQAHLAGPMAMSMQM